MRSSIAPDSTDGLHTVMSADAATTVTGAPASSSPAVQPPRQRSGMALFKKFPPVFFALAGLFLLWQWASGLEALTGTLPSATDTIAEFIRLMQDSATWSSIGITFQMAAIGFAIGVGIAIPMGLALGLSKFTYLSSRGTLNFLRVIPGIVVIPIATLVLGPTLQMGVFVVAWPIVFVVAIQTAYGVRDADPVLIETLKCYKQGIWGQIRYARIPAASPLIAYSIRIAVTIAFLGAVTAGIIGGAPGLGQDLMYAQLNGFPTTTFAIVLLLGLIGMLVSRAVEWAQPKIIFWIPS